jgi:uncharacterized coiled-coil DUF342 family protein
MISLEQVRLLESKVVKAIEYVKQVTEKNMQLNGKVDACQKRIDELEVQILEFKEEQNRIEEGILSSLEKLNQFEDAIGRNYSAPHSEGQEQGAQENTYTRQPDFAGETEDGQDEEEETEPAPDESGGELDIF